MVRTVLILLSFVLVPAVMLAQQRHLDTNRTDTTRSQYNATATQDSIRVSMERLQLIYRLRTKIIEDSMALREYLDSLDNTPLARMRRNLTFSSRDWMPTAGDRARRQEEIMRSQSADKILLNIPRAGVSIPISSIARALGLVEDVSPRIKYVLRQTVRVQVSIYNLRAETVTVLVNEVQSPGEYQLDWNFLGSAGARMPSGDYVAEVIADEREGRRLLLRKRIEVP